jgi:integrase
MPALSQRDASVLRRFEVFCAQEGIGTPIRALRDEAIMEAFLVIGCRHLAPHSLGTYRSVLVRLAQVAHRGCRDFPGSRASAPYDALDEVALWSMAEHQSSYSRITRAKVLLCATLGAGLHPSEVAQLRAEDVTKSGRTVTIWVGGVAPRRVPVRSPYGSALIAMAKGSLGYLFRPGATRRGRKNLIGEVCAAVERDFDEVALASGRARSTFLCAHLRAGTPLRDLCQIAGLIEVESLARYAHYVDGAPTSKAQLRAQARAETQ